MCSYCEGDNQKRETIMEDKNNNPLCIWDENGKTNLLLDDGEDTLIPIKFCPMCGRKLFKMEVFDEEC